MEGGRQVGRPDARRDGLRLGRGRSTGRWSGSRGVLTATAAEGAADRATLGWVGAGSWASATAAPITSATEASATTPRPRPPPDPRSGVGATSSVLPGGSSPGPGSSLSPLVTRASIGPGARLSREPSIVRTGRTRPPRRAPSARARCCGRSRPRSNARRRLRLEVTLNSSVDPVDRDDRPFVARAADPGQPHRIIAAGDRVDARVAGRRHSRGRPMLPPDDPGVVHDRDRERLRAIRGRDRHLDPGRRREHASTRQRARRRARRPTLASTGLQSRSAIDLGPSPPIVARQPASGEGDDPDRGGIVRRLDDPAGTRSAARTRRPRSAPRRTRCRRRRTERGTDPPAGSAARSIPGRPAAERRRERSAARSASPDGQGSDGVSSERAGGHGRPGARPLHRAVDRPVHHQPAVHGTQRRADRARRAGRSMAARRAGRAGPAHRRGDRGAAGSRCGA